MCLVGIMIEEPKYTTTLEFGEVFKGPLWLVGNSKMDDVAVVANFCLRQLHPITPRFSVYYTNFYVTGKCL
jgi:hypothetical protein